MTLPDLAALKADLRRWGAFSEQLQHTLTARLLTESLAAIEVLEARLSVGVGDALVEAAAEELLRLNQSYVLGDPSATTTETFMGAARSLLEIVVPAVREAARIAINEQIIAEINDPRNASQPTDFRAGLRVARILVNRAMRENDAIPEAAP